MFRMILVLFLALFSQWGQAKQVDENIKDYLVYANVYQWYGQLDTDQDWHEKQPQAVIDFSEYPQGRWQTGAHHILDIAAITDKAGTGSDAVSHQVRVTLEFYPANPNAEQVVGQYLEQVITFDSSNNRVLKVETQLNEQDDFESRYIPSAETNLIRSFLYRWTQGLDEPGSERLSHWFAADAKVELAEANIDTIAAYQIQLSEQGLTQSRRAMRNLLITPSGAGQFQLEFEYQWSAFNAQGENEIANIGVSIRLTVIDGKVQIKAYKEQYLAPKTDLGAEIRC
jgi:hypothetical protein